MKLRATAVIPALGATALTLSCAQILSLPPLDEGHPEGASEAGAPPATEALVIVLDSPVKNLKRQSFVTLAASIAPRPDAGDAVVISVTGLPDGVTADPLTLDPGVSSGTLTFRASGGATLGTSSAHVTATSGQQSGTADLDLLVQGPSGTVDLTFGALGRAVIPLGAGGTALGGEGLAVQNDGKILVCGSVPTKATGYALAVARLEPDGNLDHGFGDNGAIIANVSADDPRDACAAVRPLADGSVAIAGFGLSYFGHAFLAARYTSQGLLDTTFGNGSGYFVRSLGDAESKAYGLSVQADGKLLLGGFGPAGGALLRLGAEGKVDTTFAGGQGAFSGPANSAITGFGLQSDGHVVASVALDTLAGFRVFRVSAKGENDSTFGNAGRATTSIGAQRTDNGGQLVVQLDDKIVVSGWSPQGANGEAGGMALARFTKDGQLDTSFGVNGTTTTTISGGNARAHAVALDPDGRIVVAALIPTPLGPFGVARYTASGTLDSTFAGGYATADLGASSYSQTVAIDRHGRVLVAGTATSPESSVVVRYWP